MGMGGVSICSHLHLYTCPYVCIHIDLQIAFWPLGNTGEENSEKTMSGILGASKLV